MKKLATLLAMMAVGLGNMWAQGTIDFHNPGGASGFPLTVTDASGNVTTLGAAGSPQGPGTVRVALFVGPNGSTASALLATTPVGLATNSSSTVPLFIGTFNGGNPFTITPSTPNSQVSYMFAAWSIASGALTPQGAVASGIGYIGYSAVGQNYTLGGFGTPPSLPGPTFGTGPGQIGSFTLNPVPEPSAIALGLLGAAALFLRRRK